MIKPRFYWTRRKYCEKLFSYVFILEVTCRRMNNINSFVCYVYNAHIHKITLDNSPYLQINVFKVGYLC